VGLKELRRSQRLQMPGKLLIARDDNRCSIAGSRFPRFGSFRRGLSGIAAPAVRQRADREGKPKYVPECQPLVGEWVGSVFLGAAHLPSRALLDGFPSDAISCRKPIPGGPRVHAFILDVPSGLPLELRRNS
jgi:hypothetical protein